MYLYVSGYTYFAYDQFILEFRAEVEATFTMFDKIWTQLDLFDHVIWYVLLYIVSLPTSNVLKWTLSAFLYIQK